ncbi:MAG: hypothetical protein HFH63_01510 [Lachnospiraceae bacterium]|nr:hypothetical protein [Lachnospiraceae bacterium]
MDCQEFDKHIQAFIDKKIEYAKLDDFIEHYRHCKDCHEELEINFLLAYVLGEEDRPMFNLSKELDKHIQNEVIKKEKYYKKRLFQILFFCFTESVTLLTVIYFLVILFSWI